MKYKKIYLVYTSTKYGFGVQPTKGDTIITARKRFKKRFPKHPIHSVILYKGKEYITISNAI